MIPPDDQQPTIGMPSGRAAPPTDDGRSLKIPRGIEVLLKKAAVDPEFRQLLLEQRGASAASIALDLASSEEALLRAIPSPQLERIIAHTVVPMEQRRVFLGRVAAAMLALVGVGLAGCDQPGGEPAGISPDRPGDTNAVPPPRPAGTNKPEPAPAPATRGITPDRPPTIDDFS